MRLILYRFYKVTFFGHHQKHLFSRSPYHVVRSFPALRFDVTKMSGVTDRTPEGLSSLKKFMGIAVMFVIDSFYLCELLMTSCSILGRRRRRKRKKKCVHEKRCDLFDLRSRIRNSYSSFVNTGNLKYNHRIDFALIFKVC